LRGVRGTCTGALTVGPTTLRAVLPKDRGCAASERGKSRCPSEDMENEPPVRTQFLYTCPSTLLACTPMACYPPRGLGCVVGTHGTSARGLSPPATYGLVGLFRLSRMSVGWVHHDQNGPGRARRPRGCLAIRARPCRGSHRTSHMLCPPPCALPSALRVLGVRVVRHHASPIPLCIS
jgi:hypothetical protein